ncbi:MAG TPA: alpha/beta fold hydrolase [Actinospica sp.]|jgi:surfactin synthase thioesterase subunit|nr:alpha/beta fold hydrolase [Actinospica sp.]
MAAMMESAFWEFSAPGDDDRPRALLFPFAGGSAHSMPEWADAAGPGRRVFVAKYPGRGTRTREPFADSVHELAAEAVAEYVAVVKPGERPLLIGHSLGAHVAFAVASGLEERGIELEALVLAAAAPIAPPADVTPWHELPEDEMLDVLLELGGAGSEVLQHPQMRQIALPILRADLRISHQHLSTAAWRPISSPLLAIAGADDTRSPADAVAAWSAHTIGRFACVTLPGGHFFQQHAPIDLEQLLGRVKERDLT